MTDLLQNKTQWDKTCNPIRAWQRHIVHLSAVVMVAASGLVGSATAETLKGVATVIDGDTIEIDGNRIRFEGIDALENGQVCLDELGENWPCGHKATWALDAIVNQEYVICRAEDKNPSGLYLATCFHHQHNLNEMMVLLGLAVAYRKHSRQYVEAETTAMKYDLGIWKGQFIAPWDWRSGVRFDD